MATYELRVNTDNYTTKEVYDSDLVLTYGSKEAFVNSIVPKIQEELAIQVTEEFAAKGYTVNVTNFYIKPIWMVRQAPSIAFPHNLVDIVRLRLKVDYSIYSDVPLSQSPLPIWVMPLLEKVIKAVVVVVVVYIIAVLVIDWFKSMTTSETTATEIWYDSEGNIIKKITTKKTEPDYMGIVLVGIGVLAFMFILLAFRSGGTTVNIMGKKAGFKAG